MYYHPALRNVGAIFLQYLPILFKSTAMEQALNSNGARIMVGYRRHKNLKEILSPAANPKTNILKPPPSEVVISAQANVMFAEISL